MESESLKREFPRRTRRNGWTRRIREEKVGTGVEQEAGWMDDRGFPSHLFRTRVFRSLAQWLSLPAAIMITMIIGMPCWAQTQSAAPNPAPLIRALSTSQDEFNVFIRTSGFMPYSEFLARNDVPDPHELESLIARAQEAFLSDSTDTARTLFRQITSKAHTADWSDSQREAIHYAFLRLAQFAASESEKGALFAQAISFRSDGQPEPDLFPPPFVEAYRTQRARAMQEAKEFRPSLLFPHHRILRVNGRRYELKPELRIPLSDGTYRISAYSDSHVPIRETLSRAALMALAPGAPTLASGSCSKPEMDVRRLAHLASQTKVLYPNSCLRGAMEESGRSPDERESDEIERFLPEKARLSHDLATPLWPAEPAPKKESWLRNQWLWIGASLLTVGIIYAVSHQDDRANPVTVIDPVRRNDPQP